ncbi:MAG: molybdopterin cofactor-binding domain-containing protein, partial [Blastocatellia bacterium]
MILVALKAGLAGQESGAGRRRGSEALPEDIESWLHVGEDGRITAFTGKVEMGQGIRTSLAQAIAEELRTPVGSVSLIMGDTDLTPFDMGTFGSRTTPTMAPQLHRAATAAREALIDLAAERWKVDRATLTVSDGKVVNQRNKQSIDFGSLTKGRKLTKTIVASEPVTPADKWVIAGTAVPKAAAREIVNGEHKYPSDINRPGMLYGKIVRPAAFEGTLASADTSAAESMSGVKVVRDGDFIGVTAPDEFLASKAAAAIKTKWNAAPQPSDSELFHYLRKNTEKSSGGRGGYGGGGSHDVGSIDKGLADADHKLEQTYTVAYIAHTPLEPRAAVAEWAEGKLTVWTGTQRPFGVKSELVQAFHLPENKVRVIMPDTGSAYGGKHTGECAIEAARLAKAAGKPVKLIWTREEEFTWAYFRPAGVIDVRSGATKDGKITAWEFHNYNSGPSGINTMYEVPNQRIEFHPTKAPLRQGSYRALAATANHFARESHMDELATAVGVDPLEFRLRNLNDERLRAVFQAAADRFGWGKRKPEAGRGFGMGGGFEKGGYVATCAEVAADKSSGKVKLVKVVVAFDCGAVV